MIKVTNISLKPDYKEKDLLKAISKKISCKETDISSYEILRKSIDARKKDNIKYIIHASVNLKNENKVLRNNKKNSNISLYSPYVYKIPEKTELPNRPVVVGFGPAGIFSAYILALSGQRPIVLERGADVDTRSRDIENFIKNRKLSTESNVQFGEGGAGTFSDGKLNSGINDPRIKFVLETFVKFGAPENILYDAKPHVGTDILKIVIKNIRNEIISLGGEVIFNAKMIDFSVKNNELQSVVYLKNSSEITIETSNCILACGHSARDIFSLLYEKKFILSQKNFSMGVRIEHLQSDVNENLYGKFASGYNLPPASYKQAVHLKNSRGVYTFCMCPGGYVVASSSEENHLVINGMSYSKRDGVNANSALLVGIEPQDLKSDNPLEGLNFQKNIEKSAFIAGGGDYSAPVVKVGDFLKKQNSTGFSKVIPTYPIGTNFALPDSYFPEFITESLRGGICEIGKKFPVFNDSEAVITGAETRSTSPVRINRLENGETPTASGIYPCGEGAGYAGGIMSAAVDGIKCAEKMLLS
jgi:hypothetical protein